MFVMFRLGGDFMFPNDVPKAHNIFSSTLNQLLSDMGAGGFLQLIFIALLA